MNNLSSYCGLVDAKIRASDKDLPVTRMIQRSGSEGSLVKLIIANWIFKPSYGPVMWYFSGFLSRAVSVNRYLLSFLQPSFGLSRLRLVGWTLKALFMFKIVVWSDYYRTASQTSQKSSLVVMIKAMLLFECFRKDNAWIITTIKLIRGHSITTLTRWVERG